MSGDALRVVAVASLEELAGHADAWDALAVRESRQGLLAATYAWFSAFVEHRLGEAGRSWGCLFAYRGESLVGVLPFARRPHKLLRAARPWLQVPGDVHTTGGDALLARAGAAETLTALVDAAWRTRPRPIGLRWGGLVPASTVLASHGAGSGALVDPEDLAGRSVPLQGSWESFHENLGGNFRRNLRKARNRMARAGGLEVEVSAEAALLDRFTELETTGWKAATGGAVAHDPHVLAFYRAWCRRLAARGWLEWHFLMLDGRAIAGGLAVRWGRQIVLQRIAFDDAHARTSPGQVLLAAALEGWFAEGRHERVDCLADQAWHKTWNMERTPYTSVVLAAPGLGGLLAGRLPARARLLLKGCGPLRRLVRRVRGEDRP